MIILFLMRKFSRKEVDLRQWSPDYTKMGKGITLTNEEFQKLVDELKK
jgi:hypothetical protein